MWWLAHQLVERRKKSYLIVGFNLPDENGKVLDPQCWVIVDSLVCSLHCGFRISAEIQAKWQNVIKIQFEVLMNVSKENKTFFWKVCLAKNISSTVTIGPCSSRNCQMTTIMSQSSNEILFTDQVFGNHWQALNLIFCNRLIFLKLHFLATLSKTLYWSPLYVYNI